jgi:hypothetical protein
MIRALTIVFAVLCLGATAEMKMTLEQARARMPQRPLPPFWVGDLKPLDDRLAQMKVGEARVIARSPGGRPIHVVTYGQIEAMRQRANFNSAVGGRDLSMYRDKAARSRPVILLVGPVHGHEVEGLTGLVNLIQIMETGRDLRGKEQSQFRELAQRCRLVIIPAGNPDGIARFEPRAMHGMPFDEFQFWGMGTWADGRIAVWPDSKRQHPRTGPEIGFMGCYFNDAGINPMHDEFFAPMSEEAPAILRVATEEAPDLAVSLHSHGSPPMVLRPSFVPLEIQRDTAQLAERLYALLKQRELPSGRSFTPSPESGNPSAPFNLVSALYHVSGATAFTFESPHGVSGARACQVTLEEILEIQLSLYEAMMRHALEGRQ